MTGEQLAREIARLSGTSPEVMGRLSKLFDDYLAKK
jgi:hypothetical protein